MGTVAIGLIGGLSASAPVIRFALQGFHHNRFRIGYLCFSHIAFLSVCQARGAGEYAPASQGERSIQLAGSLRQPLLARNRDP